VAKHGRPWATFQVYFHFFLHCILVVAGTGRGAFFLIGRHNIVGWCALIGLCEKMVVAAARGHGICIVSNIVFIIIESIYATFEIYFADFVGVAGCPAGAGPEEA
jgi:hypothetical protein